MKKKKRERNGKAELVDIKKINVLDTYVGLL